MSFKEPIFHSHITDKLPDDDPRAFTSLHCAHCKHMVHAVNNETMDAWFETRRGPICLSCFHGYYYQTNEPNDLGLEDK